jgi:hypothetical protein
MPSRRFSRRLSGAPVTRASSGVDGAPLVVEREVLAAEECDQTSFRLGRHSCLFIQHKPRKYLCAYRLYSTSSCSEALVEACL